LPGQRAADILARIQAHCDTLLPAMKAISPACDITIDELFDTPALDERGNTYLAKAIMPLCGHHVPGRVSFGTEAGILQDIGIPTVVCGPGRIAVAHQPDEYVEIEQLGQCMAFLAVLADRMARGLSLQA
jgi:acetylornithine deacetylase